MAKKPVTVFEFDCTIYKLQSNETGYRLTLDIGEEEATNMSKLMAVVHEEVQYRAALMTTDLPFNRD